jgi:bisphosphoglycerate-independent phosphoglycerate mutase (AlkP superfamily)
LGGKELQGLRLYDIAPTVLNEFGMQVPSDMIGKIIDG